MAQRIAISEVPKPEGSSGFARRLSEKPQPDIACYMMYMFSFNPPKADYS